MFPLLIQILGAVWKEAKLLAFRKEPVPLVALGAVQVMVGLFHIGLEQVKGDTGSTSYGGVYCLSALYITCGMVAFLFHPSIWWICFTAFVNLVTAPCTILGIIPCVIDLRSPYLVGGLKTHEFVARLYILSVVLTVLQMCICISLAAICIRGMIRREREEQVEEGFQLSKEGMTSPAEKQ